MLCFMINCTCVYILLVAPVSVHKSRLYELKWWDFFRCTYNVRGKTRNLFANKKFSNIIATFNSQKYISYLYLCFTSKHEGIDFSWLSITFQTTLKQLYYIIVYNNTDATDEYNEPVNIQRSLHESPNSYIPK